MTTEMQSEAAPSVCPSCKKDNVASVRFCEYCGANLSGGGAKSKKGKSRNLGNLATNAHEKSIKSARTTLIVVGVLTIGAGIFQHVMFNSQIADARSNPGMVIDEAVVSQVKLMIYAIYAIGAAFFGFSFWARSNPFAACLTGLIVYVSAWLIGVAADPTTIAHGIIMKIIIISFLIKGVKAGIAWRQMKERDPV